MSAFSHLSLSQKNILVSSLLLLYTCTIIFNNISTPLSKSSPKHHEPSFKIATWNLRVPFPIDNQHDHNWSNRLPYISQAISKYKPDIIGLQEDCYFMNHDLLYYNTINLHVYYKRYGVFNRNGESKPTKYWPTNVFTNDGMRDGEHNSIWWRKDRFECLENHTFWLSDHPDVPGSSFDEDTGRVVNCVLLQDIMFYKRVFGFCSLHMPTIDTKIERSIIVLEEGLRKWNDESSKKQNACIEIFIVGDFNFNPLSYLHETMTQHGFLDLRNISSSFHGDNQDVTANDWYKQFHQIIDYIWIFEDRNRSSSLSVYKVNSMQHISVYAKLSNKGSNSHNNIPLSIQSTASDHLMVLANITWL